MSHNNEKVIEPKNFGLAKLMAGSLFAATLVAVFTVQSGQAQTEEKAEASVAEVSADPEQCSTASLASVASPDQMACLMDVKAQYGTYDCKSPFGFSTALKADVEQCETKVSACLSGDAPKELKAFAPQETKRKNILVVKQEPAKLSQLGRAQSPAETSSYFIKCDNTDEKIQLVRH